MASILKKVGQATNVKTNYYEVDTVRDMWEIDTTYETMGSRCYVINDGELYALNSNKEWKIVPTGGGGYDPSQHYIWDGGDASGSGSGSTQSYVWDGGGA